MKLKYVNKICNCFYRSLFDLVEHDGIEHAGYISFLVMIGFFPFLVFFAAIVGLISNIYLGEETMLTTLTNLILSSPLSSFIEALKPRIVEITGTPPQSFFTIAIISAIWTASSIFEGLRTILNRAYRVNNPPPYIWRRLWSIIEFVIVIILTLTLVFLIEVLPSILHFVIEFFEKENNLVLSKTFIILQNTVGLRGFFALIMLFLCIAYTYYFLPNKKLGLVSTFPGTIISLLGWWVFSRIFTYYITVFPQINLIYGSIAGIIIALFYFYICSMIFIYGAELNYHLSVAFQNSNQGPTNMTSRERSALYL